MQNKTVLVTGGSGFVAGYCIIQLLAEGYSVRTTIRSLSRREEVLTALRNGGAVHLDRLSFFEADLMVEKGWAEAVDGCEYVMHVATPLSLAQPKDEDEVIRPAVDGTLRVLRASRNAKVKRVVLTSSFAAVGYGLDPGARLFNEDDWTDLGAKGLSAYVKSKALAERAAWDFIKAEGHGMEMAAVNPMAIFGPLLGKTLSGGHQLLQQLLDGKMRAVPKIDFGIVDVRDVADLHMRAMTHPQANGQRFLALAGGVMTFHEIAMTLREGLGDPAKHVTTKTVSDWMLRALAPFSKKAKQVLPLLGQVRNASNDKAKNMLGWHPRSNEEAVLAAGRSLLGR